MTVEQTWLLFMLLGALLNYLVIESNYLIIILIFIGIGFVFTTIIKLFTSYEFNKSINYDSTGSFDD